jgi:NADH dehydrogenase
MSDASAAPELPLLIPPVAVSTSGAASPHAWNNRLSKLEHWTRGDQHDLDERRTIMILITGATGFVGRHLVRRLSTEGQRPRCLVRSQEKAQRLLPLDQIELAQGDTTQADSLPAAMHGIDTIVHSAFITADLKETRTANYHNVNVIGTRNVVAAAKQAGVKKIVLVGGLGTQPDKPGTYMQGRYLAEQAIKESGLQWDILQPSIQFGEHAAFFTGLADLIRAAPVIPVVGKSSLKFQPIWVEDVVTCLTKLIRDPERTGKTFVVGGPDYLTYGEILDILAAALGKKPLKAPAPIPFVRIGAAVMQSVLPKPPITTAALTLFRFDNITDLDAIQRDFGFQPLSWRTYLAQHGVQ